jgi:predicted RecB family endonuclease
MGEMTAQEAAEWGKTLSFETVWATIQEVGRKQAEVAEQFKKTDRMIAENAEQFKEVRELSKENAKQLAKLEKTVERVTGNVGGLNRSMGELIETLIAARLWEKFPQYELKRAYQRLPIYDEKNALRTDIDILLVNTGMCMAVEVKHALNRIDEVDRHLKRMELIRRYPPEQVGTKQLIGAMAGGVVDPDVKDYIYRCGFYVLELTGESVHLIEPPEGFEPKRW